MNPEDMGILPRRKSKSSRWVDARGIATSADLKAARLQELLLAVLRVCLQLRGA